MTYLAALIIVIVFGQAAAVTLWYLLRNIAVTTGTAVGIVMLAPFTVVWAVVDMIPERHRVKLFWTAQALGLTWLFVFVIDPTL